MDLGQKSWKALILLEVASESIHASRRIAAAQEGSGREGLKKSARNKAFAWQVRSGPGKKDQFREKLAYPV
jgi:hypothetical protein